MLAGMGVMVAGLAGFLVWQYYGGYLEYRALKQMEKDYVNAMTADTYGGKTPQETLDMFVDALNKEDVDLASKYFMLDDNLSREKWVKTLGILKERGALDDMARDIRNLKPNPEDSVDANDYKFVLLDDAGMAGATINFRFNEYSKIWKIESL